MRWTFQARLFSAACVLLFLTGCSAPNPIIDRHGAELDSLSAVNRALEARLSALRDSVQFYSDIDTGQYYRDRREQNVRIQKLEYDLSVCRDGGRTIEMLSVDAMFEPASATLTEAGRSRIGVLADTLKARHTGDVIRVEGHADSSPIGPGLQEMYPSNWELSAARAAAVVRYMVDEHGLPTGQVEVASYGITRPRARNDTARGRSENRRIRIAVVER